MYLVLLNLDLAAEIPVGWPRGRARGLRVCSSSVFRSELHVLVSGVIESTKTLGNLASGFQSQVSKRHRTRDEIDKEIRGMIMNIISDEDTEYSEILLVDGYVRLDVLFEKWALFWFLFPSDFIFLPNRLKNSRQSVFEYVKHNGHLYSYGANMKYVLQICSTPYHIKPSKRIFKHVPNIILRNVCTFCLVYWEHYKTYMKHPIVFGLCGIHPLYSNQFDLNIELNLRAALETNKVIGVGEIGIDLKR